jgi:ABC-type transporter Mla subunit MlaD
MDPRQQRFRLGLFVMTALLFLAVLIFMFSGSRRLFTAQNHYTIVFDDAPGVSPGTPVRRSGVKIGSVTKVDLDDVTGKVRVEIAVEKKFTLRTTDEAVINQDLLSRDTTIDFIPKAAESPPTLAPPVPAPAPKNDVQKVGAAEPLPGALLAGGQPPLGKEPPRPRPGPPPAVPPPQPPPGEPLPPGSVIQGRSPTDARAVIGQATTIIPTVEQSLNAIRRSAERLEQAIPQLQAGAREFTELGRSLRETVPELRQTNDEIRLLLQTARIAAPNLRRTNEELQLTLRNFGSVAERVDVLLQANQDKIVRALDQATDVLQRLSQVLSEENQKNFTATLRAVQAASTNFDAVARNTDEALKEGTRTAQRFQQTLNQADQVLMNLNQATRPLAERSDRLLRNLDSSVEQLNRILSGFGEALVPLGRGEGTVQKFFTDPSLYNNLNQAACMVTKVLPRVDRILQDVEVFADKIARHPESIGIGGAVRPSAGIKEAPSSMPQPYRHNP